MSAAKSVFETRTGKSSLIVIIAGIITICVPHYCDYLERHTSIDPKDIESGQKLTMELLGFLVFGGGYASLAGRASTTPAYSPSFMSGLSKEEVEAKMSEAEDTESKNT